ncbi:fibronectin type III domain-containing protein [Micromonospora rifamycinica]|uniref:Fibronectin type III domain-containing protein n=3 Tax=Micromonospora rifamycinica TaxID=291594 RepID=A0A1C5JZN0_9ACTN|nr:fibronectin type III domain-containing protein [Micromonospora rifamycinica]SCG75781.1 Fibronectin type III domain-containing protein [Micromonospora rifamycinica]
MLTRRWQAAITAVLIMLGLAYQAEPARAAVTTLTAAQLNTAFNAYGDAGNHWTGADGTTSVALPDGRVIWLFSDTFLGTVNTDGSRPANSPMINNSAIVQSGTSLGATLTGGSAVAPTALVVPAQSGEFFWVGDAVVESGELRVIYNRYRRSGTGVLDFTLTGVSLARFALPALTLTAVTDLPVGSDVNWGAAITPDGAYTYIYGTSTAPGRMKFGHVARVSTGALDGPWQFWTGTTWSADRTTVARLLSGVGTSYSVQKVGSEYVLVTHENNLLFDPQIVAYRATSPTGPWTGPVPLYQAPEITAGGKKIVYDARLHPELATTGKLLISYNVNSLEFADTFADARLYRPRFVDVSWPPPSPGTGLPAAPTGLTVTGQDDHADLTWAAASGVTSYRVYQRDVTGGQTHFARHATTATTTSRRAGLLIPGHRYEFKVAGVNSAGEGPTGATVSVTPQSSVPVADAVRGANRADSVPGSYLVRLKEGAAQPERVASYAAQLVAQAGGTLGPVLPRTLRGFGATLTQAQAVNLAAHPDVLDVEQNATYRVSGEQANPYWHLDRIDQREATPDKRYVYPNDGAVRAYVVDSGIRATHEEFGGRVDTGFNAFDGSTSTPDCGKGHGTAVASLLGGTDYGAAKAAGLVPVKVFNCTTTGETVSDTLTVVRGIDWAMGDAEGRLPAVMNLSLTSGADRPYADSLDHATRAAAGSGIVVVAAAGNQGGDACDYSPARTGKDSAVITVGASDMDDSRLSTSQVTSNLGQCVNLFAPGADIVGAGIGDDLDVSYNFGTSMAAPLVAGAAAMLLHAHPDYGPADVKTALTRAATVGKLSNIGTSPNLLLYVERPPTVAPADLTATARDDGTIALDWAPVADQNLHYLVSQRDVTAGEPAATRWPSPVFDATDAVARNLIEGHRYEFTVAAANSAGTGPESNVAAATTHLAVPAAPTGLAASPQADGSISLTWNSLGTDVSYWVHQRDVTTGETDFTRLDLPVTDCCTHTAGYLLHGHQYEFKVSGLNAGGEGPTSTPVRATSTYPKPAPPTGLTAAPGAAQVVLNWTASTTPNVWYLVRQRDVTAGETDFTTLELPVTTCCTFTAGLLANGHTYEFTVTTTGQGGESTPSNLATAKPMPPLPPQVTGLTATPRSDGGITLTWAAPAGDDFFYDVYQRDVSAGQGFSKLPLPITTCCTMTAGLLVHQHVYEFKVAATNAAGVGPQSTVAGATSRYTVPGAPANLRGTTGGNGTVDLDWDAPGPASNLYWIYRRDVTAGEAFVKLPYPTEDTHASIGLLVHNHVYEFRVAAENQGGQGSNSNTVQVTARGGLPGAPSGLTAGAGDGKVTLSWTASATSGVSYQVYQRDRTQGQSWQKLPLPVTGTSLTANYLVNGHTYEFKVAASNVSGDSVASNVASARPMPPTPQAPTGLTATAGDAKVTLRWTASPTANVSYWIESRASGGNWTTLPVAVGCCAYTVNLLFNGTTYEFRVRATNLSGDSTASNVASARPMPPTPQAPTGLTATAGDAKVTLRWTASPTANVSYWIESRASGGNWTRLPVAVGCCAYTVNLLFNGTTYEFRVRATNLSGDSPASSVVSARPWPPLPQAPTTLKATVGQNSVLLTWLASPSPRVTYRVYMRNVTRGAGWGTEAAYLTGTSAHVPMLTGGNRYEFKVVAENVAGQSAATNTVSVRVHHVFATVTCTDYYVPIKDVPVGWTSVKSSALGVAGGENQRIRVQLRVWKNDVLWTWSDYWVTTGSDGSWGVPVNEHESNGVADYDLFASVYGPNGEDWGRASDSDHCDGGRG